MREFVSSDVGFVTGALMMTRRDVIDRIGGYDPDCELDWGDVDFCLRARKAGYRVRFVAEATAVHLEGSTRGNRTGRTDWFFAKWWHDMKKNAMQDILVGGRS
jgi:GT2 family glycosyltransferase